MTYRRPPYSEDRSPDRFRDRDARPERPWLPAEGRRRPQPPRPGYGPPRRSRADFPPPPPRAAYPPDERDEDDQEDDATDREPESAERRPRREILPPADPSTFLEPWVQLKYFSYHPCIFPRLIAGTSKGVRKGELVHVYDKNGHAFGSGLWNSQARVPLRVLTHDPEFATEDRLRQLVEHAAQFRLNLNLDSQTTAYRVVHSDGDRLSGFVVDRYGDVLRVEVHSYGVWQRLEQWLPLLHEKLGTKRQIISVDPDLSRIEAMPPQSLGQQGDEVRSIKITEHGVRYLVDFTTGHKTGFFCDQRDNRRSLTQFTQGQDVLDLCCYTGGFSLSAKVMGGAAEVTGVDLDEKAIEQAKQNANLNQCRINWVHTDTFKYARQMQQLGRKWGVVVLDPPKLIFSRDDEEGGYKKYEDLNRLASTLVAPGGIFVTCSCSGQLSESEFIRIVTKAAHREGKKLQFFNKTGPGADHPVFSNCPESSYLKVLWARVW
jgi:23S rRNA (cytosine1962-C5)-methyltransferase